MTDKPEDKREIKGGGRVGKDTACKRDRSISRTNANGGVKTF